MKKVSKEQGVSFQASPAPSRSHISRQCSFSPSFYKKLLNLIYLKETDNIIYLKSTFLHLRHPSHSPLSYSKLFGSPAFQWVYLANRKVRNENYDDNNDDEDDGDGDVDHDRDNEDDERDDDDKDAGW